MPRFLVTIHSHSMTVVEIEGPDADTVRGEAHSATIDDCYTPEFGCIVHDISEEVALDDGDIDVCQMNEDEEVPVAKWHTTETLALLQDREMYAQAVECLSNFSPQSALLQLCYAHDEVFTGVDLDAVDWGEVADSLMKETTNA